MTLSSTKLITANLRFVVKVVFEYKSYGVKLLDLISGGNIGLMMAVKKFNPYKGYRFISYAIWWIRAYIQNFIIKTWSLVKIGTTQAQKKLFYKIGKVRKALESNGENEKKYDLLAKKSGCGQRGYHRDGTKDVLKRPVLDAPFDEGQELTHLDLLREEAPNQEEALPSKKQENPGT